MYSSEKKNLTELLDKYCKENPLCTGKCDKCYYAIILPNQNNKKTCPLVLTRDLLNYLECHNELDMEKRFG